MRRRHVVTTMLALYASGWFGAALAQMPGSQASGTQASGGDEARTFIQGLAQAAITTIADKSLSTEQRNDSFRRLFVSGFDIPAISRFVLARYWRAATPTQQQDFIKLFEEVQVLMWARRFGEYHGESLQIQGANGEGNEWVVDSLVMRPRQSPLPVQWRVHRAEDGKFRITDVMPEGVSMALTHRDEYAAIMKSNGGSVDALLGSLRAKIEQLRGGT